MPVMKLRALGQTGVITDAPSYDLPPEGWNEATNVRFVSNRIEKMKGYAPSYRQADTSLIPLVFTQEPTPDRFATIYATDKKVFRVEGNSVEDITGPVQFKAELKAPWNYTVLTNTVVLNNPADDPVGWVPADYPQVKEVKVLPNWGVANVGGPQLNWKAGVIRAYKNYLVALDMTEESIVNGARQVDHLPQRVRWSDVAYVNALPENWYEDKTDGDAGYNDLSDCTGRILDARPMRDSLMIYTNREVYAMRFTGGEFVFDFTKLFPDAGVLNTHCVTEFEGGNHFVVSEDDIFVHDGSTRSSIAKDIVLNRIMDEINSVNYRSTKVFTNARTKEVWICYATPQGNPDPESFACNKAAVWNWTTGVWTFCDLPDIYWLESLISPSTDLRAWDRPKSENVVTPSQLVLDSPIYELPVGKDFRIDVLYRPGEGYTQSNISSRLKWTLNNQNASFVKDEGDQSIIIKGVTPGKVLITVALENYSAIADSYELTIVDSTQEVGLREQKSEGKTGTPPGGTYRPDPFPDSTIQWDSAAFSTDEWDRKGFSFASKVWMGISADKCLYQLDIGTTQDRWDYVAQVTNSKPVYAHLQRYGIAMADTEPDLSYHKTWRTIYPLLSGTGNLKFTIAGSNNANVPPTGGETHSFVIGDDYKIDCFLNARFLSFDLKDADEGDWSMTGMDVDYFLGGNR